MGLCSDPRGFGSFRVRTQKGLGWVQSPESGPKGVGFGSFPICNPNGLGWGWRANPRGLKDGFMFRPKRVWV
ncbi:hypothetical protein NC653_001979 [Populus alba x Populus x berolinensis]|uniref:Uncharacterized protein n=1 Tax=Populus alba x Populus x berolinensis TaxID=444605 RepID=A0AAD6RMK3_9ROSI|nr:hypothetical protein NC653_001979 [Populus alba x Populus x berolinensis]